MFAPTTFGHTPGDSSYQHDKILSAVKLPRRMRLDETPLDLPQHPGEDEDRIFNFDIVHGEYRGRDVPKHIEEGEPGKQAFPKSNWALAVIRDPTNSGAISHALGDPRQRFDGSEQSGPGLRPGIVEVEFSTCTQRPCIIVRVALEDLQIEGQSRTITRWANFCYSARDIALSEDDIAFELLAGKEIMQGDRCDLTGFNSIGTLKDKDFLAIVGLYLKSEVEPRITGIDKAELVNYGGNDERWRFAKNLISATLIDLVMELDSNAHVYTQDLHNWMRTVLYICAYKGEYWYYKKALQDWHYKKASRARWKIDPPRWLVTKWLVDYEFSDPVSKKPLEWNSFEPVPGPAHSNELTRYREILLAEMRESKSAQEQWQRHYAKPMCAVEAEFLSDSKAPHEYICHFYFKDRVDIIRPHHGLRVRVVISHHPGWTVFEGTPCENLVSGADLSATLTKVEENRDVVLECGHHFAVSLEFKHDVVGSVRTLDAIEWLGSDRIKNTATDGIYLPGFVFGAPQPPECNANWLEKVFTDDSNARRVFEDTIASFGLNSTQTAYASSFLDPSKGASLISGPESAGRTYTMMAVVSALAVCGIRVLCTAPSDAAVNEMMEIFEKLKPIALGKYAGIRFSEALMEPETFPQAGIPSEPLWQILDRWNDPPVVITGKEDVQKFMDAAAHQARRTPAMRLRDQGFAARKAQWIVQSAQIIEPKTKEAEKLKRTANQYLDVRRTLRSNSITARRREQLGKGFRGRDQCLTEAFLRNIVSVVFVTNHESKHETLTPFEAKILFSNDAAATRPGEAMIPMAAHAHRLKYMSLGGDPMETVSRLMSARCNEFAHSATQSLFATQVENPWLGYKTFAL